MALDSEHDFHGYEPTVKDTGWSLTITVVFICILVNLSLPILVRLAAAYDKRKAQRKGELPASDGDEPNTLEHESEASKPTLKGASHSKPAGLYQIPYSAPSLASNGGLSTTSSGKSPGFYQMPYSTPSVVSNGATSTSSVRSVSSSVMSQVSSAILGARPHRLGTKRRKRGKNKAHFAPALKADVSDEQPGTVAFDDTSSVCSKSVMSTLDQDAVSIMDAIDAKDGNEPVLLEQDTPSNLWWQFLEIADWDEESKRLTSLTIPYTIQGCTEGVFQIINVAIIGHYLGVMEANVYVVVTILLEFSSTITYGFGEGEELPESFVLLFVGLRWSSTNNHLSCTSPPL
jgi:hypothetical protein